MTPAQKAKAILTHTPAAKPVPQPSDYLSTGLTLVNLATYGRTNWGMVKGGIYRLVGPSSSGKTWIAHTALAEAANNPAFDNYDLIHDDPEHGAKMDVEKYFGKKLAGRISKPFVKDGEPCSSVYVSDFYGGLVDYMSASRSVVWSIDSLDALLPDPGMAGKMTDGKAKAASQNIRQLLDLIERTRSILIMISQVRVNMRSIFAEEITSGGQAPEYYASFSLWLHKSRKILKKYRGREYPIGHMITARVKKNRLSGVDRMVSFPFYPRTGLDDVGSCVDFLIQAKHWRKGAGGFDCPEFVVTGSKEKIIRHIWAEDRRRELQVLTGKVWKEIEETLTLERPCPYE